MSKPTCNCVNEVTSAADGLVIRGCCTRRDTFWNGQIGEIRPLIQWGLPGLFSRVFVTPDEAVSVFNDTAGLARTGAEEVLVELAELFPEFSVADLATKPVPQDKADDGSHTFQEKSERLRMRK
jgi:hypothetical protein